MPEIVFLHRDGARRSVDVPLHYSLMQAAVSAGISGIEGVCGGSMACATCHVHIHPDWAARVEAAGNEKTEEETDTLELAAGVDGTSRLSCQIAMTEDLDGLVVILP